MNDRKKLGAISIACLLALSACGGTDDASPRPGTAAAPASPEASARPDDYSTGTQSTDVAGFSAAGEAWLAAFASGAPGQLAAFYADDAVVMPEAAPKAEGRAAVARFLSGYFARLRAAGYSLAITPDRISTGVSENLGYRSGTYAMTDASGARVDSGKWLQVWRRDNGEWRILRDTWNSDGLPVMLDDASEEGPGNTG